MKERTERESSGFISFFSDCFDGFSVGRPEGEIKKETHPKKNSRVKLLKGDDVQLNRSEGPFFFLSSFLKSRK
jgi:hypothetical protein